MINSLEAERYDLALINYPMFAQGEFFREVLTQYGQTPVSGTALDLYHQISEYAFENVSRSKFSLVVIDEAQLITEPRVYEEIRLLLNLQMEDGFLLHFLLAGQPELRESIMQFPQLEQRISIKYHLHHLGFENTVEYIRYRLSVAGASEDFFTGDAYEIIHKSSVGVARRINNLCDLCLLEGSYLGLKKIDQELVKRIL
jgi:general secretion pathway protein A